MWDAGVLIIGLMPAASFFHFSSPEDFPTPPRGERLKGEALLRSESQGQVKEGGLLPAQTPAAMRARKAGAGKALLSLMGPGP